MGTIGALCVVRGRATLTCECKAEVLKGCVLLGPMRTKGYGDTAASLITVQGVAGALGGYLQCYRKSERRRLSDDRLRSRLSVASILGCPSSNSSSGFVLHLSLREPSRTHLVRTGCIARLEARRTLSRCGCKTHVATDERSLDIWRIEQHAVHSDYTSHDILNAFVVADIDVLHPTAMPKSSNNAIAC